MGDRVISREEQEAHDFEALFGLWQDYAEKLMGKCPICGKSPEFVIGTEYKGKTYLQVGHGKYPNNCCIWGLSDILVECNKDWRPS